jgi:hypothetical protein
MKLTSYCAAIYFFLSVFFVPAHATDLFSEKKDKLLADRAWVLGNLGKYLEAEEIYKNLLKKKMYRRMFVSNI